MPRTLPRYLEPTAPIAPAAVLTGDPKRAMELATAVTDRPLMSNLARGLWGYHGRTESGAELSIHSTGIGGPSTALVVRELHGHGVRRAIRVGTATALGPDLELGVALPVAVAVSGDGTSGALLIGRLATEEGPAMEPRRDKFPEPRSSEALISRLTSALRANPVRVSSHDLPVDANRGADPLRRDRIAAADFSSAAFLAQAENLGIEAAAVVVITASPEGDLPLADADAACLAAGKVAAELLTAE